jgi:hypothetical protein
MIKIMRIARTKWAGEWRKKKKKRREFNDIIGKKPDRIKANRPNKKNRNVFPFYGHACRHRMKAGSQEKEEKRPIKKRWAESGNKN